MKDADNDGAIHGFLRHASRRRNHGRSARGQTVCRLGNRKNELINKIIEEVCVESDVRYMRHLRHDGAKIGIVTSNQNCSAVLKAVKLDIVFDVQVDGNTTIDNRSAGKPVHDARIWRPQGGLESYRHDHLTSRGTISGVEARSHGKFRLVLGVARKRIPRN